MSMILTALTAVERLAAHGTALPPGFARALAEDLEYGRFGAALPELPRFGGWTSGAGLFFRLGPLPRFAQLYREHTPVAFGLKAGELVANGALVGTEAGLAFLAGYFTQLCVARALDPLVNQLVRFHQRHGESSAQCRDRIEWSQSLHLMHELHGSSLVGTAAVRAKLQIRKGGGPKGIGRGLYELVRVSSNDSLGMAPSKVEVDGWMRGLYLFSLALGTPLGKLSARAGRGGSQVKELYRGPGVDVFGSVERGLAHARAVLGVLGSLIRRGSFTARSRQKVLALLPDGPPSVGLAPLPDPLPAPSAPTA